MTGDSAAPRRARFPGFDSAVQAGHWDTTTASAVLARLGVPPPIRFFTPAEEAIATALCDQLLDQDWRNRIPLVNMIDSRLAELQTDGWRYADMPEDGTAWQRSLAALDADARGSRDCGFAELDRDDQAKLIQKVQDQRGSSWHGLSATHVWSLWTRYACTAFYSHPAAWNEIGFPGPAYPRGYKNAGLNSTEPFEVADAAPADDPVRKGGLARRASPKRRPGGRQ